MKVLLLGKTDNEYVKKAVKFCRNNISELEVNIGRHGEPLPEDIGSWEGDYIISFLSSWIIPGCILKRAKIAAINFHPASPDYPGIGCYNFALYDRATEYGAMCHHMEPEVDAGDIIAVRRFPVYQADSVETLIERTYDNLIVLFYEIMAKILSGQELPKSKERWKKRATTREELDKLATITPDMNELEVHRRVVATTYGEWKPVVKLGNYTFELKTENST